MRRIVTLLLFITIILTFIGCTNVSPILYKDNNETKEEEISYTVEQVLLSKGFQSVEPKVEVLKKGLTTKLIASLGLFQSSGIKVDKIVKIGNEMNIHLQNQASEELSELVVPQVIIELNGFKLRNLKDMQINIVNENYKPLKLKLSSNDAINKIDSEFKIASNIAPVTSLIPRDGELFWDVSYNSIFDKNNPEAPLANLTVLMDANSGDIISTKKIFISSLIDEGYILDYITDKFILYSKPERDIEKNTIKEHLWSFDIENNEKSLLYSTNLKISNAIYSPDLKYVSVIESNENDNCLYIIPRADKKAYKVLFEESLAPIIMTWKDNNTLYIVDNTLEDLSNIYNYNIKDNITSLESSITKNVTSLRIKDSLFMITEEDKENLNFQISLTEDWNSFRHIDQGCCPKFITEDKIAYLKNSEKENKNSLTIYDLNLKEQYDILELNISNYFVQPNGNIIIVENNPSNNEYTVLQYYIKDKSTSIITKSNSERVFYNEEKNLLYVYMQIPFESDKTEMIYSIDLSKITNTEP